MIVQRIVRQRNKIKYKLEIMAHNIEILDTDVKLADLTISFYENKASIYHPYQYYDTVNNTYHKDLNGISDKSFKNIMWKENFNEVEITHSFELVWSEYYKDLSQAAKIINLFKTNLDLFKMEKQL